MPIFLMVFDGNYFFSFDHMVIGNDVVMAAYRKTASRSRSCYYFKN